jgi:hypothetical protein
MTDPAEGFHLRMTWMWNPDDHTLNVELEPGPVLSGVPMDEIIVIAGRTALRTAGYLLEGRVTPDEDDEL